jgi:membrane protein involved in colicin uptake
MSDAYSRHIAGLSHVGGLPRHARQPETPAAVRGEIETLRKVRTELMTEIEAVRKHHAAEKRNHAAELAAERAAHDAAIAAERAAHNERIRRLDEILGHALEQHNLRTPAVARALTVAEGVLR